MTTPERTAGGPQPLRPVAAPTVRLERTAPGGNPRETAGRPARPAHPDDESTVGFPRPEPAVRQRTIRFGRPAPVRVTVTARPKPRRRLRTWPWIAAVVVALLVVGAVLLVMLLRGDRVEGRLGSPGPAPTAAPSPDPRDLAVPEERAGTG